jgi:hypothetical protein
MLFDWLRADKGSGRGFRLILDGTLSDTNGPELFVPRGTVFATE